jgi:large subunit ribosomal protein L6
MSTDFIEVPEGVDVNVTGKEVKVKGKTGELSRAYPFKEIEVKKEENKVLVTQKNKSSVSRTLVGTYMSHIKNMITGAQKPFVYRLKVAFTHFPITVSATSSEFSVQNFLGEKRPRKARIPEGVKVSVKGDEITVESPDIELAGKTATLIELTTKVRNKDKRIFQDGIYIVEKGK